MWTWLKGLLTNILGIFRMFIDEAIPQVHQILIAEFKEAAIDIVECLSKEMLTNDEKRRQAFNQIKQELRNAGKETTDSIIYFLVELAYQYVKNAKPNS